ncbi:hypothetical protein Z043_100705 [Scleropages formosus]|uniref:Autophagy-related protein 13-like n=1 Tax=Scleropages formosus TaxID=113540 RepID=A0A0P7VT43_SCLFO|nr:hypothetical protein Z043_100705 [Scleropages formosus]
MCSAVLRRSETFRLITLSFPLLASLRYAFLFQLHSSHFSCQPPAVRMADPCYLTACTAAHPHQVRQPSVLGVQSSPLPTPERTQLILDAFYSAPSVTTTGVELPFAAFVSKTLDLEENDPMVRPPESPSTASPSPGSLHSVSSSQSGGPTQDDYILVDFKPAFSKDGLLPMDLGTFYREFQNPPQLSVVSADDSAQSMAEDLDSLPEKLASYEKNMEEFDAFVETLQ